MYGKNCKTNTRAKVLAHIYNKEVDKSERMIY